MPTLAVHDRVGRDILPLAQKYLLARKYLAVMLAVRRPSALAPPRKHPRRWETVSAPSAAYTAFFERLAGVPVRAADRSFASFVVSELPPDDQADARARAASSAADFHAADPERLPLQAAALGERADRDAEAERMLRLPRGYDGVVRDALELGRRELSTLLEDHAFHDWEGDPYARGAHWR